MRIAVFSDVHGNLPAMQAILADIDKRENIERVLFAGDLCLVGPRPQETLELLRARAIAVIVGNTDEWIRNPPPLTDSLSTEERTARQGLRDLCQWTEKQLDASSLIWLDDLRSAFQVRFTPSSDPADDLLIVHANPLNLLDIIFPSVARQIALYGRVRQTDEQLAPLLEGETAKTIAFGHLHLPGVRLWRDKRLINISSVSLPGDDDGRAKYAILSWAAETGWTAEYIRVAYSVEDEIAAYRQKQPPGWADRVEQLQSRGYIRQRV